MYEDDGDWMGEEAERRGGREEGEERGGEKRDGEGVPMRTEEEEERLREAFGVEKVRERWCERERERGREGRGEDEGGVRQRCVRLPLWERHVFCLRSSWKRHVFW